MALPKVTPRVTRWIIVIAIYGIAAVVLFENKGPGRSATEDYYKQLATLDAWHYPDGFNGRWFGRDESTPPAKGYLVYPNAWAQFNNHRRQVIDAVAAARALNRILVIPTFEHHIFKPDVFDFYQERYLKELGPIITLKQFLRMVPVPGGNGDAIYVTPDIWGDSVKKAGLDHLTRWHYPYATRQEIDSKLKKETFHLHNPYGGIPNTKWIEKEFTKYREKDVLIFSYLFSQIRFAGEQRLFAHIRSHMKVVPPVQEMANKKIAELNGKYKCYIAGHLRRGDHEGFCKGNNDCYPTNEMVIKRLQEAKAVRGCDGVFLATNARKEELAEIQKEVAFELLEPDVVSRVRFQDGRMFMLAEVQVAAAADFFIGNNWSTLSANIMEERSVQGKDPTTFRYWGGDKRPLWYGREGEKSPETCLCGEAHRELPYDWRQLRKMHSHSNKENKD